MPFKLIENPEFTHDVAVMVPGDDGPREEKLRTRFRHLTDAEREPFDTQTDAGMKDFLRAAVVRFEDVVDDDDQPIDCDDALKERIIGVQYVRIGVYFGYFAGMGKARLGN